MKLRAKLLIGAVGIMAMAMLLLGGMMIQAHRATYMEEAEFRARALLSMLAVSAMGPASSGRPEDLDSMLSALVEHDLDHLDIEFVAILDNDRRIIGHTDITRYGRRPAGQFFVTAASSPETLVSRTHHSNTLLVSMPLVTEVPGQPGIRWGTVVAGIGLDRAEIGIIQLFWSTTPIVLTWVFLAILVVGIRLEQLVIRPVKELTRAAESFASGDLESRAEVRSDDELLVLCRTFNDMSEQIERHTKDLEEQIRQRTLELEEANARLAELAITDGLTGFYNRRYLETALATELRRSNRSEAPLSVMMLDIDHFKHYNDSHGHQAGDAVLRDFAGLMRSRVRETDISCRYGGEEFVVILPGTGRDSAVVLADEIRSLVAGHPFDFASEQPGGAVTVSIGVATHPPDGSSETALLKAADDAMYLAKESGRDRVETSADAA